jgi:hypothetical protein
MIGNTASITKPSVAEMMADVEGNHGPCGRPEFRPASQRGFNLKPSQEISWQSCDDLHVPSKKDGIA